MTGTLVRLKLRLLANQLRRSPWQLVGLGVALLYGAGITAGLVALLVALRYAPLPLATAFTVGGGSLAVLGFAVVPVFTGVDDTLDPRRFALLGVERTRLALGLVVAAVVGVPGFVLVVVGFATVATWSRSPLAALTALVAAPLTVLLCTLVARISAATAGLLLSTRRSRETTAAVVVVGLVLLAPLVVALTNLDLGVRALARVASVTAVLAWTPIGATWAAPASVAAGSAAGLAQLLIGAATVVALAVAWRALVGVALTGAARRARPQTVAGQGWFGRFPATQVGAVAARTTTYWARDVRYRVSALVVPVTPVALVLLLGVVGVPGHVLALIPVPVIALFAGWSSHNDIAYDSTAIWLHVAAGVSGTADRLGRLVPVVAVGAPLIAVGSVVCGVLAGRPVLAAAIAGVSGCLFLAGMGVGAVSSAVLPYPVPRPGASPFQQPTTSGGVSAIVQSVLFLLQIVCALPAIGLGLAAIDGPAALSWAALGAGLAVGLVVFAVTTRAGARLFERRGPELLAAALRA